MPSTPPSRVVQIFSDEHRGPAAAERDAEDAAAEPVHDARARRAASAGPAAVSVPGQRRLFAARPLPHVRRTMQQPAAAALGLGASAARSIPPAGLRRR